MKTFTAKKKQQKPHKTHKTPMELTIEGFDGRTYVVDVDVDDTVKDLRRKVATTAGFAEDSFDMDFRGNGEGEGMTITALSAGDTVVLRQSKKQESIAALRALGETDLTPERLARVEDPEVARLFLQAEVVTTIPRKFLSRTNLRSLDLSAPLAVTTIGDNFLYQCSSLESINLSGLRNVTIVGDYFLHNCTSFLTFEPFNFAGLSRVASLGNYFLSGCTSLTTIDFAGSGNVTRLGDDFLSGCTSLTSIDFAGLGSVTSIGSYFLSGCTALRSIDLAGLSGVIRLGCRFMHGCVYLETSDQVRKWSSTMLIT